LKIHLTKPAVNDLHAIEDYISHDNPLAAENIINRILEAIEYLEKYPGRGRTGRVPNTRELVVSGTPFIVVYQVRLQIIYILRVLHTARKWP
jgi:addiction module RelE/StbE family toxin